MTVAVASMPAFLRGERVPFVTSPYLPLLCTWGPVVWCFPVGLGMLCHFCDTGRELAFRSWDRVTGVWEG